MHPAGHFNRDCVGDDSHGLHEQFRAHAQLFDIWGCEDHFTEADMALGDLHDSLDEPELLAAHVRLRYRTPLHIGSS
jgi:hypothetical protein